MRRQDWIDLAWWTCAAGAVLTALLIATGLGQTLIAWSTTW